MASTMTEAFKAAFGPQRLAIIKEQAQLERHRIKASISPAARKDRTIDNPLYSKHKDNLSQASGKSMKFGRLPRGK